MVLIRLMILIQHKSAEINYHGSTSCQLILLPQTSPQYFIPLSASCHWKPTRYWGQRECSGIIISPRDAWSRWREKHSNYKIAHNAQLSMRHSKWMIKTTWLWESERSTALLSSTASPGCTEEWEVYMRPNTRDRMERIAGRESRCLKRQAACKQARMGRRTISRRHGENAGAPWGMHRTLGTVRDPAAKLGILNPWATDLGEQVLGNGICDPRTACANCSGWSCMYHMHPDFHMP